MSVDADHAYVANYVSGTVAAYHLQPDGRSDMCDSCPDMTYYDGKLINSCRMDEYRLFGGFVSVTERQEMESTNGPTSVPVGEPAVSIVGEPEGDGREA